MPIWEDYDLEHSEKWFVMDAPPLNPEWVRALTRIGGLNPFGKPVLRAVWGATHQDEMSVDSGLKYWIGSRPRTLEGFAFKCPVTDLDMVVKKMEDVPPAVLVAVPQYCDAIELGERRWIIEGWRSNDFLAKSGRYQDGSVVDYGESTDYPFCRNCHTELEAKVTGEPKPCDCGSKRYYFKTEREDGHGQLLKTSPPEGCYDFFCRLENQLGEPMEADALALRNIEHLWRETQKSEREKLKDMLVASEPQRALNERAASPANPFQGPAV